MPNRNEQIKVASSTAPFTARAGTVLCQYNVGSGTWSLVTSGGNYGTITLTWVTDKWVATSSLGGFTWNGTTTIPGQLDAPICTFTTTASEGTFTTAAADSNPLIEMASDVQIFAYTVDARQIEAQVSVTPKLFKRRLWATIRHTASSSDRYTMTLAFIRNGVLAGAITQRYYPNDRPSRITNESYYSLGAEMGKIATLSDRQTDNTMLVDFSDLGTDGIVSRIHPIDVLIDCDTIRLTCSEYSYTSSTSTNLRAVLFCLSQFPA